MRKTVAQRPFFKRTNDYQEMIDLLADIFSEAKQEDGYICIRSGPPSHDSQSWLDVSKISENLKLELLRHDYRDTFYSLGSYHKSKNPTRTLNNLQNIFAFGIDVDYSKGNTCAHPLDVYQYIMDTVSIPTPNYVEYGHCLRLIYIFREPLRLYSGSKEKMIKGFTFLQKCLCNMINQDFDFCANMLEKLEAEVNPATSFFRIPGSVNSKGNQTIQIKHMTEERYTLQEFFTEHIPKNYIEPLYTKNDRSPGWKKRANEGKTMKFSSTALWKRRKNAFLQLRTEPDVHRKRLCFLYGVALKQLNEVSSKDELINALYQFNTGFDFPLQEKVIRSSNNRLLEHDYKFKDSTIEDLLGSSFAPYTGLPKKERDANRYQIKKDEKRKNGKLKFQQIETRRRKVKALLQLNTPISEIAKQCETSIATINRDIKYLKTEVA